MKETQKAQTRRAVDKSFDWNTVFSGEGLDVGSGDNPLCDCRPVIGDSDKAVSFDLPDGAGDDLRDRFLARRFDFIHGSNVLEHALSAGVMLRSWIGCLKPGGYIVATVPDWELYEKKTWPSRWNAGHRSTWSMDIVHGSPHHHKLPEWISHHFEGSVSVLLCRLVDTNYDHNLGPDVDQTFDFDKGVECCIEFVLQRA